MNRYRRTCLGRLLAAGVLPLLPACSPDQPLSLACHVWPGYELIFLARDEGWLPANQVRIHETRTATESIQALKDLQVQAAALTLDEVLLARSQGIPLTIALVFDVSSGADKVISKPSITRLSELKGKRIAVETTAVGSLMLIKTLALAGLTADDLNIVKMQGEHHAMWASGEVDAMITYEPTASLLINQGAVSLFDSRQMPEMIFDVLAVRSDALKGYEEAIRALVLAHFRGLTALRTNPADTTYRLAGHLGMPGNEVMSAYRGLKMPDQLANLSYLQGENSPLHAAAHSLSSLMLEHGTLHAPDDLSKLFSTNYLPRPT